MIIVAALFVSCHNTTTDNTQTSEPADNSSHQTEEVTAAALEIKHGEVNVITEDQFVAWITEVENEKGFQYRQEMPAIVDCYADWCRPCHAINPIMVELAKKYNGKIIIYKLNVDKAPRVTKAFNIASIPALLFFKPNTQPVKIVGAHPQEDYEQAINDLLLN